MNASGCCYLSSYYRQRVGGSSSTAWLPSLAGHGLLCGRPACRWEGPCDESLPSGRAEDLSATRTPTVTRQQACKPTGREWSSAGGNGLETWVPGEQRVSCGQRQIIRRKCSFSGHQTSGFACCINWKLLCWNDSQLPLLQSFTCPSYKDSAPMLAKHSASSGTTNAPFAELPPNSEITR